VKNSNIELLHTTEKRARFKCPFLKEDYNEVSLLAELRSFPSVDEVRINRKVHSIIFSSETALEVEKIQEELQALDIADFKGILIECTKCIDENPTKLGIYRAVGAMALEVLSSNENLKFTASSLAYTPWFIDGVKEFFTEGLTSRVLEATAIGVSIARKDYLAANGTTLMLEVGEYMEDTITHQSDDLIKELSKPNIKEAWIEVVEDGKEFLKQVRASKIEVGDIVVIGAGETIPVDGHVLVGNASVNQVSMTGESEPIKRGRGDRVISGTVVEDGRIKIWAEHVGEHTATARIEKYITSSLNEKSDIGLKATRLADKLVPVTLSLAGLSYFVAKDPVEAVASVLQADYSCALKLATPVAFKSSISKAGKDGILIKGAKSIENLAEVDTFVFDKTGTLTHGELEVVGIESFDDEWGEEKILNLTASAEEHYFHPVAEAVVKAAKNKGFVHMHHEEVEFIVAHGVKTVVDGKEVIIGSRHFLEDDENIDFVNFNESKYSTEEYAILYIGYDKKLLGTIIMVDKVRENAKSVLKRLKDLGVKKTVMLTGDVEAKADKLAKEVGIDEVYSNLKPTDKADIVSKLQSQGLKVAFVGDGINDTPALISSDVGISMSKGADIAKVSADVSLLKDDISAVADVKELSVKTIELVKRNFDLTIGINSGILTGATFGLFSPLTTAILHNGTTIGLLLNSIRGVK
jgi:heavy metal translocating P-type ATPase